MCEFEYGGRFLIRDEQKQALRADTADMRLCVPGPAGPVPGRPVAQPGEAGQEGAVCAWLLWCSRGACQHPGHKEPGCAFRRRLKCVLLSQSRSPLPILVGSKAHKVLRRTSLLRKVGFILLTLEAAHCIGKNKIPKYPGLL